MKKAGFYHYAKYLVALLLFGSNGIVASHISLNSYEIVYLRTMIGSLMLILLFGVSGHHYHRISQNKRDFVYVCLSGIATGIGWLFLYEAYQLIGVSFSSLLYYCGPVIVMMVSPLVFRTKLTPLQVIGFLVVVLGIFLVNGHATLAGASTRGFFYGAMAAVMYAIMIIFNKMSRNITGFENSVIQLTASFLTVAVYTVIRQGFVVDILPGELRWILFLGLVNTGVGCYLYFSPMARLPVQTVAVCGYLEPLSAVVLSAVLLNEKMAAAQIVGAICIIGGALMGELENHRSKETPTRRAA